MAYSPTEWKTGDVVTSAKLNKIEQGIADGVMVVQVNFDAQTEEYTFATKAGDIYNAWMSGAAVIVDGATMNNAGFARITAVFSVEGYDYVFVFRDGRYDNLWYFAAATADDYPTPVTP